jgi:hypothetical protein
LTCAHRFALPMPRPPRSPCLRCQTSRMQAGCSRRCGNVQRAPPTWYCKGKYPAVSRFRTRDLTGAARQATAHDTDTMQLAEGSISSPLTATSRLDRGQGSTSSLFVPSPCLGLADKTSASIVSPTVDSRHSIAPNRADHVRIGRGCRVQATKASQIVILREHARSPCATLSA